MPVRFDTPPANGIVRRGSGTDGMIAAAAVALAVVAAFAAQMGVPQAQPLVGAIVILAIAYRVFHRSRRDRSAHRRVGPDPADSCSR